MIVGIVMNNKPENTIAQKIQLASALTFCGGFIDSYTYMLRGHTLSAGQTGNVIFFSSSLANGNLTGIFNRGLTILGFIIGLILVVFIHSKTKSIYWRIFEMLPLMLISLIVGFIPTSAPNYLIVPLLALGMAMQSGAFKKINGNGYSNVFTSGNLRKTILSWSQFYILDDEGSYKMGKNYLIIVLSFTFGALISAFVQKFMGIETIWIASFILLLANVSYGLLVKRAYEKEKTQKN